MLQQRTGIQLTHVPYRGGGPALQDLMAGQIDATFAPLSTVASYVQSGRLRALAVAAPKREPVLPDVPTFAQAGVADFTVSTWYGLFAPKATPAAILDTLHAAIQAALADPDVKRIWAEQGAEPDLQSRQAFTEFVAARSSAGAASRGRSDCPWSEGRSCANAQTARYATIDSIAGVPRGHRRCR